MKEIICPKCGTAFTIDESMYDSIVKQIRNNEFKEELKQREAMINKQNASALALEKSNHESLLQQKENEFKQQLSKLQALLDSKDQEKKLAVEKANNAQNDTIQDLSNTITSLKAQIDSITSQNEKDKQQALDKAQLVSKQELSDTVNAKDKEIQELKAQLANKDQEKELAVSEESKKQSNAISELNNIVTKLQVELEAKSKEIQAAIEHANVDKEQALNNAKLVSKQELTDAINTKNQEIESLKAKLAGKDQEKELAVSEENKKQSNTISELNNTVTKLQAELEAKSKEVQTTIEQAEIAKEQALQLAGLEAERRLNAEVNNKELEITTLQNQLLAKDQESQLALTKLSSTKDLEIARLNNKITANQQAYEESKIQAQSTFDLKLKMKDEELAYYKDLKAKASTKMIGETLEQHCLISFNQLRPTAFRNAYFEKDNDARTGSKGDFIFRDYDEDGTEIVSIMFEMKNEADDTVSKHKNSDFFKELDKDRKEKNCEYAVLVSLLEKDSEEYTGITDVSYRYDKMYVVRPQQFISIITLLRNAALNSLHYKKELEVVKNQNIDISHFEENMASFQSAFGKNYESARNNFNKAIDEIDKSITHLQKIKDALTTSENQLRLANDKAQGLTIKKLTKNAPSVKAMFDAIDNDC